MEKDPLEEIVKADGWPAPNVRHVGAPSRAGDAKLWLAHALEFLIRRVRGWKSSFKASGIRGLGRRPRTTLKVAGYPGNHAFQVRNGALVPGPGLYHRWRTISALFPRPLESLLDIGCCKGYFVVEAAAHPSCRHAVGIDVSPAFVGIARAVQSLVGRTNAEFHLARLHDVAQDPALYRGPFQTVLLINAYHYLYWGSFLDEHAALEHEAILSSLARVSTGRLILSSPLDVTACGRAIRAKAARQAEAGRQYTRQRFVEIARTFFDVELRGQLGRRPLYVLDRRG